MRTDMMRRILFFVAAAMAFLCGLPDMNAQKASLSTDLLGYANFVTMNLDASCPVSRHWSINAGVKYNPFTFDLGEGKEDARNRQQTYLAGVRC